MMPMRDGTSWQDSSIDQIGWFNEYQMNFKNSKLVASLRLDYNKGDAKHFLIYSKHFTETEKQKILITA